ncbi:MAG: YkvA family protein [Candidatus Limnocylindrales bacterium]
MARSTRSGRSLGLIRTLNYLAFMPLASRAPTYIRLLWALVRDERIPTSKKAVLGLAVGYLASPIDVVPDFVPFLGAVDDLVVAVLAIDVFLEAVPEALLDETLQELGIERELLERDRAQIRRMVPRPIRRVAQRLPDAIEGVADLIRSSGIESRLRTWINKEEGSA